MNLTHSILTVAVISAVTISLRYLIQSILPFTLSLTLLRGKEAHK